VFRIVTIVVSIAFSHSAAIGQSFTPNAKASSISFSISNFGINVEGTFKEIKGRIFFSDANLNKANFDIQVETNSIATGIALRDKHLKNENYFHVEKYSKMMFHSKYVKRISSGQYLLIGNLSIKNNTKEISIPFHVSTKGNSISFDGNFVIDRRDFGLGKNNLTMGDEVKVQLQVVADPDSL
jgi:polyisoprenoid-binding protein YceI